MSTEIEKKNLSYQIFDRIANRYDLINRILSLGIDHYWRWMLSKRVSKHKRIKLLDLATGTGDQLLSLLKRRQNITDSLGIDLSMHMLKKAEKKALKKRLTMRCAFEEGNAEKIPLETETIQLVTMSFGIRNVPHPIQCLEEMARVLEKEGQALILEFSLPCIRWIRALYLLYLRKILPKVGRLLSKDHSAYTYLQETIETFPYGDAFLKLMKKAGFQKVKATPLSFGIVTLYAGEK